MGPRPRSRQTPSPDQSCCSCAAASSVAFSRRRSASSWRRSRVAVARSAPTARRDAHDHAVGRRRPAGEPVVAAASGDGRFAIDALRAGIAKNAASPAGSSRGPGAPRRADPAGDNAIVTRNNTLTYSPCISSLRQNFGLRQFSRKPGRQRRRSPPRSAPCRPNFPGAASAYRFGAILGAPLAPRLARPRCTASPSPRCAVRKKWRDSGSSSGARRSPRSGIGTAPPWPVSQIQAIVAKFYTIPRCLLISTKFHKFSAVRLGYFYLNRCYS